MAGVDPPRAPHDWRFADSEAGTSRRIVGMDKAFAKLQHCVDVLLSEADGNLYAGYSTDLKQRLTGNRFPGLVQGRPLWLDSGG